ncbi:MAG: uroporphyrinogen III synthase HEM4 [Rhodospirillales bacterium]|nr:uroporphyrinogen III synthase HEM4 [Rhodospirillales bacterium]MCB9996409.1 uroporphyrinogen III synthase HEM4 [Rhodospirillales bacterium]
MAATMDNNDQESIENAEEIIERFGGIRPMATKMDVPVTTVQGWKKRNVIPGNRRDEVIEAAEKNDIDLSDLVAGAANENSSSPYKLEQSAAYRPAVETKKEEPVITAQRRPAPMPETRSNNDMLFAEIKKAQSVTFTRSASFSIILVAVVVGVSVMLLWPTKQQVEHNRENIAMLQGAVEEVKKEGSFLRGLIPTDLDSRFSQIQEQTRGLQDRVTEMSAQANAIVGDVMDGNADIATRIERVGNRVSSIVGPVKLNGMLEKIRTLQQTAGGQQLLSTAMIDLNALMDNVHGSGGDLDQALQQAQGEDDALGQTLEGVAPQDLKAAAMLLGLAQMRSSFNRSAPFEDDLALMQKMVAKDDPELQAAMNRLAPKAASGVLTPDGLKGEFKGLAGDIVVSSLKGEDVSIQEKARARFNDVLSVEKDGELLTGTDTQAKVARAQKMLDEGDIQGALAELQSLEGEAAQTAQPFMNEAQMTLMAQQLQGMMTQKVLNNVAGPAAGMSGGMPMPGVPSAAGMEQLIGEIKNMAPQKTLIRDPNSGFTILAPKTDIIP